MISTSIICCNNLENDIDYLILKSDFLHFDIMDKDFSSCTGLNKELIPMLKSKGASLDVHIMSNHPKEYVDYCIKNNCEMISIPIESKDDISEMLREIRNHGLKAGISINPNTSLDDLLNYYNYIDFINVMTVFPGPAGQEFEVEQLNKIYELNVIRRTNQLNFLIEIDGSCNLEHIHMISNVKPDIYVIGKSGLFGLDSDITKSWEKMQEYINRTKNRTKKIFLHADLVGNSLKEQVKEYLTKNFQVIDLYKDGLLEYPECAQELCENVLKDEYNVGILFCGTGIGMAIAANKVEGIRAAVVSDVYSSRMSREHNDANVLCLGARVLTSQRALPIIDAFLNNDFIYGKHYKRVNRLKLKH